IASAASGAQRRNVMRRSESTSADGYLAGAVKNPGGRQLVPGLGGGAFCALATDEARLMSSSERSGISMRMESRYTLRVMKKDDRIAQFISAAPSQCSSALPSTKRHMSNQLVV